MDEGLGFEGPKDEGLGIEGPKDEGLSGHQGRGLRTTRNLPVKTPHPYPENKRKMSQDQYSPPYTCPVMQPKTEQFRALSNIY